MRRLNARFCEKDGEQMEHVSNKILSINKDLAQLFAEMEQSYELLKKTSDANSTMCKQNMVTMRDCHENLIDWMRAEVGLSDSEIYEAAENRAPGKVDERIDTYAIILALANEGYVSDSLEKKMHRVRMLGNDAAHFSAIDNGKPNVLRGKSPEQIMALCDEMYDTLIEVARQMVEIAPNFKSDPTSAPKFTKPKKMHDKEQDRDFPFWFLKLVGWILVAAIVIGLLNGNVFTFKNPRQEAREAITMQFSNINNFQTAIGPVVKEKGLTRETILNSIRNNYKEKENTIFNASIIELSKYQFYNFDSRYQGEFDVSCYSSNPSVASVDWTGKIVAEGKGYAYVEVTNWGSDYAVYRAIIHVK